MQRLVYWLVYPLLWLVSQLPFRLFYIVSDLVFFVVYHIAGYRKKTVTSNLRLVFPEKSSEEIRGIRKRFYRHMCDMFLEMIKSISISEEQLKARFTFTNLEEVIRARQTGKSSILMCGHYASYEWANAIQFYDTGYKGLGIYKKIKNPHFDKLIKDIRARFNAELITSSKAISTISSYEEQGIKGIYAMIADQSPKLERAKYWTDFLGHRVPVFTGSEKLARTLDMVVLYLHVEKRKRGYYEATFIPITVNPKQEQEFYITSRYLRLLEDQIRKEPELYLWTHKRWKHRDAPIPEDARMINHS